MRIECPACARPHSFEPAVCTSCNSSFAGHLFRKYRKPLLSASTALLLGGYGGYKVTDTLREEARHPLSEEYAIVEACLDASARPLSSATYARKRDICLCAYEAASREVGLERMATEPETFLGAMRTHASRCSQGRPL